MAPAGIDAHAAVLGDLSPQALIQQHYAAAPDLLLNNVGKGLEPAGVRCDIHPAVSLQDSGFCCLQEAMLLPCKNALLHGMSAAAQAAVAASHHFWPASLSEYHSATLPV